MQLGGANGPAVIIERLQKDLDRGQALLAIDDETDLHGSSRLRDVFQYDGANEMGARLGMVGQSLGERANILPQWFPLNLLLPDVGPLIQGDDVAPILIEELADRDVSNLHAITPA
jgi:hypothetical protein